MRSRRLPVVHHMSWLFQMKGKSLPGAEGITVSDLCQESRSSACACLGTVLLDLSEYFACLDVCLEEMDSVS